MTFQNARGHRQAWTLMHKTALTDPEIADLVSVSITEVELLRAEYDHLGDAATGDWFKDQRGPTIT